MFWALFALYILLSCSGLLFIKLGGSTTRLSLLGSSFNLVLDIKLVVGLCCYILSFVLFTYIIQKHDLSYIYPISAGLVNVLSVLMGVFVLKENVSIFGVIGALVVVIGIVLMNIKI